MLLLLVRAKTGLNSAKQISLLHGEQGFQCDVGGFLCRERRADTAIEQGAAITMPQCGRFSTTSAEGMFVGSSDRLQHESEATSKRPLRL